MRTYASDTSVPIGRSRGEIDDLLRAWGCDAIAWADEITERRVSLRFVWSRSPGEQYAARLTMHFPSPADVRLAHARAAWKEKGWRSTADDKTMLDRFTLTDKQAEDRAAQAARAGHRVLLLWIKAALNAVAAGLLTAEQVFLAHLEGADGQTVSDVALPRLRELLGGGAGRLLGDGR